MDNGFRLDDVSEAVKFEIRIAQGATTRFDYLFILRLIIVSGRTANYASTFHAWEEKFLLFLRLE
ncbi:MAG: hypothetical protein INR62_08555 [Rhodospirillales bacterium]|nr:hypothetical protein [Acetobacter sp.]